MNVYFDVNYCLVIEAESVSESMALSYWDTKHGENNGNFLLKNIAPRIKSKWNTDQEAQDSPMDEAMNLLDSGRKTYTVLIDGQYIDHVPTEYAKEVLKQFAKRVTESQK